MKDFFRTRSFKILAAVILLLLGVVLYTASVGNTFMGSLFGLVSTPMQQIAETGVNAAQGIVGDNMTPEQLRAEIERLQKELDEKNQRLIEYYKIKEEHQQYSQYLELKQDNTDFQFVPATKIGSDPNEFFYGFTIDKGTLQGVEIGDPVVTMSKQLVGYVSDVGATYAQVKTILDASISVGGHDMRTRDGGVISGTAELAKQGFTKMRYISNQHAMEQGDTIITSGLGGIYPYGLIIGEIQEIRTEEHSISLYALLKPLVDIQKVSDVFVIIEFEGQGEVVKDNLTPERGAYATGDDPDMTISPDDGSSGASSGTGSDGSSSDGSSRDGSSTSGGN